MDILYFHVCVCVCVWKRVEESNSQVVTLPRSSNPVCSHLRYSPCMVAPNGIEPMSSDYRSDALPLSYRANGWHGWDRTTDLPVNSRLLLPSELHASRYVCVWMQETVSSRQVLEYEPKWETSPSCIWKGQTVLPCRCKDQNLVFYY